MLTPLTVNDPFPEESVPVMGFLRPALARGALISAAPRLAELATISVPLPSSFTASRKSLVSFAAPRTIGLPSALVSLISSVAGS